MSSSPMPLIAFFFMLPCSKLQSCTEMFEQNFFPLKHPLSLSGVICQQTHSDVSESWQSTWHGYMTLSPDYACSFTLLLGRHVMWAAPSAAVVCSMGSLACLLHTVSTALRSPIIHAVWATQVSSLFPLATEHPGQLRSLLPHNLVITDFRMLAYFFVQG